MKKLIIIKQKKETLETNKMLFSKYEQLESLNRIIIEEFIDKIYISKINTETNTKDIQIKWNFE